MPIPHLLDRLADRSVLFDDVLFAIRHALSIEPHSDPPKFGGTCWRIHGKDGKGRRLAVGVEAYLDNGDQWAALITVIDMKRRP